MASKIVNGFKTAFAENNFLSFTPKSTKIGQVTTSFFSTQCSNRTLNKDVGSMCFPGEHTIARRLRDTHVGCRSDTKIQKIIAQVARTLADQSITSTDTYDVVSRALLKVNLPHTDFNVEIRKQFIEALQFPEVQIEELK